MHTAAFLALNAGLALALYQWRQLAALHALATLAVGVWVVMRGRLITVAYVTAYIAGSEIVWRMCRAGVFYEYGKYATVALLGLAMIRMHGLRWRPLPIIYFLLLTPSIGLTLIAFDLGAAREQISFNLSGPLAIVMSIWFFTHIRVSPARLRGILLSAAAPILGAAAITVLTTYTAADIRFESESNVVTSGGFGPNQVSTMLGLGALFALLNATGRGRTMSYRALMIGITMLFAVQSAMTFSRGGLIAATIAGTAGGMYLLRDTRSRLALILGVLIIGATARFVFLPRLEEFTGGALSARFRDTDPTNRDVIIRDDLRIFLENPVLGVGPGGALLQRTGGEVGAHTEFTRLPAEHGLFGIGALLLLLWMCVIAVRRAPTVEARAVVTALVVWSLLTMLHSALRLAAPAFALGLAFAVWQASPRSTGVASPDETGADDQDNRSRALTAG